MKLKQRSLKGKLIVTTRSASANKDWQKYFKGLGATIYSFPTIQIAPLKPDTRTLTIMKRIADFEWVVVTSMEGLRAGTELIERPDIHISPGRIKALAVTGFGTKKMAQVMGYQNVFQPSSADTMALGWELDFRKGARILFLKSAIASHILPNILAARGARVTDVPVYRTISIREPDEKFFKLLEDGAADFLAFASPSAVRGFFVRVKDKKLQKKAQGIAAVAIGPRVAASLKKYGFKDVRTASEATMKGVAEAMI
jgi:uroporphyrinogen III methyltransferase/synthase